MSRRGGMGRREEQNKIVFIFQTMTEGIGSGKAALV